MSTTTPDDADFHGDDLDDDGQPLEAAEADDSPPDPDEPPDEEA